MNTTNDTHLTPTEQTTLREFLTRQFNPGELDELIDDLDVDTANLKSATPGDLARGLVAYFDHRGTVADLLGYLIRKRPSVPATETLRQMQARFGPPHAPSHANPQALFESIPTRADAPLPPRQLFAQPARPPPTPSDAAFVGREDELRTLAERIKTNRCVSVTAVGGMGKSALAAEFARRYGPFFAGGVFWLNMEHREGATNEIAQCGAALGFNPERQDEAAAQTLAAWRSPLPRLLIFDNCEDAALFKATAPTEGGCRVLVTKRNDRWLAALGVRDLPLLALPPAQSLALLRQLAPRLPVDGNTDADLRALAQFVEHLPLALHLLGCYLDTYAADLPPAQVLRELHALGPRADALSGQLDGQAIDTPTGHTPNLARTFLLNLGKLDAAQPRDALARALFARAACLAPGLPFPRSLLRLMLAEVASNDTATSKAFADAINRLLALGLMERAAENLRLHRLLALYAHSELHETAPAELDAALDAVEQALAREASRIIEAGLPAPLRAWQEHLSYVADAATARGSEPTGRLSNALGHHLWMIGSYPAARAAFERALKIFEQVLGVNHPNVATLVNNLGMVMKNMGDLPAARAAFERALKIDEAALGPDHPDVAIDINNLGDVMRLMGDLPAARAACERALKIDEAAFGPDHPNVAIDVNNLGEVMRAMGDLPAARAAFERALRILERALGAEHPNTQLVQGNLARLDE